MPTMAQWGVLAGGTIPTAPHWRLHQTGHSATRSRTWSNRHQVYGSSLISWFSIRCIRIPGAYHWCWSDRLNSQSLSCRIITQEDIEHSEHVSLRQVAATAAKFPDVFCSQPATMVHKCKTWNPRIFGQPRVNMMPIHSPRAACCEFCHAAGVAGGLTPKHSAVVVCSFKHTFGHLTSSQCPQQLFGKLPYSWRMGF